MGRPGSGRCLQTRKKAMEARTSPLALFGPRGRKVTKSPCVANCVAEGDTLREDALRDMSARMTSRQRVAGTRLTRAKKGAAGVKVEGIAEGNCKVSIQVCVGTAFLCKSTTYCIEIRPR